MAPRASHRSPKRTPFQPSNRLPTLSEEDQQKAAPLVTIRTPPPPPPLAAEDDEIEAPTAEELIAAERELVRNCCF